MMSKSKAVFATNELHCCLETDWTVTIRDTPPSEPSAWTATVSSPQGPRILHSKVPSAPTPLPRAVQHHSRFSVGVLQSLLQKSVRRRKPLPSVHLAMELSDKSLGHLLRRLPIIALEDSTWHPQMDLVVWLLMAHSKDFGLSAELRRQVWQIVYQVASCARQDRLPEEVSDATTTLETTHPWIWAMQMRVHYGGMEGDKRMLTDYARVWSRRLADTEPHTFAGWEQEPLTWRELPERLHRKGLELSQAHVPNSIVALVRTDLTLEGIDYHCSSVLQELDRHAFAICHDLILEAKENEVPEDSKERRTYVYQVLQACMWNMASGVNMRLDLDGSKLQLETEPYRWMWNTYLVQHVRAYQERYILDRLANVRS